MTPALTAHQEQLCAEAPGDFSNLRALYVNCTLKRSPEPSHTAGLAERSVAIMRRLGVEVDTIRAVDHDVATGVYPDMTEHGWDRDEWPELVERVLRADVLVLMTPIWLGEKSSPQADAGWVGAAGPGPSYLDPGSGGPENDFTNRNTTFMTWNLLHTARWLKDAGGFPAHGNRRSEWDAGCRHDFANPEHR